MSFWDAVLGRRIERDPYDCFIDYADGSIGHIPVWAKDGREALDLIRQLMPEGSQASRIIITQRGEVSAQKPGGQLGNEPSMVTGDNHESKQRGALQFRSVLPCRAHCFGRVKGLVLVGAGIRLLSVRAIISRPAYSSVSN